MSGLFLTAGLLNLWGVVQCLSVLRGNGVVDVHDHIMKEVALATLHRTVNALFFSHGPSWFFVVQGYESFVNLLQRVFRGSTGIRVRLSKYF